MRTMSTEELKARLLAPLPKFSAIPIDRLRELQANIRASQGWDAGETPDETPPRKRKRVGDQPGD